MMVSIKLCMVVVLVSISSVIMAQPTTKSTSAFWKGTPFDKSVEEMRSLCAEDDPIACLKFKAISFLDSILKKDNFQLTENLEINRNSYRSNKVSTSRSDESLEENIEEYMKGHDISLRVPLVDSSITLDSRNLDKDEVDFKVNFQSEARGKSKLKKILIPILVFVLLKAITLVPLALGILGLKAWNALQLSFFSFIVAVGLAIFQLCRKIAADNTHAQIAAHTPWDGGSYGPNYVARGFQDTLNSAHELVYSAYAPQP